METKRINWIKIGIEVLAVFVFILLLVWIIPFGNKDKNKTSNFGDNFDTYRESIKKYYKNESNLPEVSEVKTLKELIDNKVVSKLYDQTGKLCDTSKSKVSVIKIDDNNYQLDIELVCGNESDRVLDTIVVSSKTTSNNTNNTNNNSNTNSNNTNNANNNNNTNTTAGNKVTITTLTQYRYTKDTIEKEVTYKCPEGYTLNDKVCVKTSTESVIATPIYSEERIDRIDAIKVEGNIKTIYDKVVEKNGNKQVNCKNGNVGDDNKCHSTSTYTTDAIANTSVTCDNASDKREGNTCYKSSSYLTPGTAKTNTSTSCTQIKTNSPMASSGNVTYQLIDQGVENACSNTPGCYKAVIYYKYTKCTKTSSISYTCPSGTSQEGSSCRVYTSTPYAAHVNTTYSCTSGTLNGNKCIHSKDEVSEPEVTYTKVYTCNDGYTLATENGVKVCYKQEKTEDKYYCSDASYTYDEKTKTCYKKVDKKLTGYTCPSGYTEKDGICYKNEETVNAKKWTKCIITHFYTWNSNANLDGWVKTGETRTITIN